MIEDITPENSHQRSDYTGNFIEDIDNSEELAALEKDPTIFPNSTRVYVQGEIHPSVRVPMREIRLSDTEHPNGRIEENPPIRVYDCSGPWGDPDFNGDVREGLPALRREWILNRNDVEEYEGREITAADNGYLSEKCWMILRRGSCKLRSHSMVLLLLPSLALAYANT